jgi:(p)ppGpp synthase/HD superfamily hydrolase
MEDIKSWESKFQPCEYSDKLLNLITELNKTTKAPVNILEIKKACYYAREYHGSQLRKSGHPYYYHPIEVAYLFTKYVRENTPQYYTTNLIIIAILHDVIEDTKLTKDIIAVLFGNVVANGVEGLTRIKNGVKHKAYETLDSLYLQDKVGILYIKLFDRLHNARTLNFMSYAKQIKIAEETYDHFTIYAECLELDELNNELINICSQYIDIKLPPLQFNDLNSSYSQDN